MKSLLTITLPPFLYEITHEGTILHRIIKYDLDSPRWREVDFFDLNEEVKREIVGKLLNHE